MKPIEHVLLHPICVLSQMCGCKRCNVKSWPALSRCGCIGPRASGGPRFWWPRISGGSAPCVWTVVHFCQILLALKFNRNGWWNLIVSKQCSPQNEHWHKRWKVKPVDVDLLFESEDSNSWPFNHSNTKCYILHFLLGLYWTLNRIGLSGQLPKKWWVAWNASHAKKLVGHCSEKIARWGLRVGKNVQCAKLYFYCAPKLFHLWWPQC